MVVIIIIRIEMAWLSGHHVVGDYGDAAYDAVDDNDDDDDADDDDDIA